MLSGISVPELLTLRHGVTDKLGKLSHVKSIDVSLAEMTGADSVVLSDENIIGYPDAAFKVGEFYPEVLARSGHFADWLGITPVKILFSIRPYETYFPSAYAHWLAQERRHLSRDQVIGKVLNLQRGWHDVVADIKTVFPDTPIAVTEYTPDAAFIDRQLAELVGSVAQKLEYDTGIFWNRGLRPPRLKKMEALIETGRADDDSVDALRKQKMRGKPTSYHQFWSDAEKQVLQQRYARDRQAVFALAADTGRSGKSTRDSGIEKC